MSNTLPSEAIDDGKSIDDGKRDEGMEELKEQDRWLPIANVARIMKSALPDNAKIAKEAKETMQECVSEFISFITSEASEKCQAEKRKTVNGEDILFAMTSLGFENYSEALKIYLAKYRETQRPEAPSPTSPAKAQSPPSQPAPQVNAQMFPGQYPMGMNSMNLDGYAGHNEYGMYGHGVHNGVGDPYSNQM